MEKIVLSVYNLLYQPKTTTSVTERVVVSLITLTVLCSSVLLMLL